MQDLVYHMRTYLSIIPHISDCPDHVQPHVDAAVRVVFSSLRETAHAEVAVA